MDSSAQHRGNEAEPDSNGNYTWSAQLKLALIFTLVSGKKYEYLKQATITKHYIHDYLHVSKQLSQKFKQVTHPPRHYRRWRKSSKRTIRTACCTGRFIACSTSPRLKSHSKAVHACHLADEKLSETARMLTVSVIPVRRNNASLFETKRQRHISVLFFKSPLALVVLADQHPYPREPLVLEDLHAAQ